MESDGDSKRVLVCGGVSSLLLCALCLPNNPRSHLFPHPLSRVDLAVLPVIHMALSLLFRLDILVVIPLFASWRRAMMSLALIIW